MRISDLSSDVALPICGFKNVRLSTYAMQSLTGGLLHGLSIAAGVSYSRMLGKYADSPIVADAGDADQGVGPVGLSSPFWPNPGLFCMAIEEKQTRESDVLGKMLDGR